MNKPDTISKLFALGSVMFLILAILTATFLGNSAIDIQLHDTYFVIALFHLIILITILMGIYALAYFFIPKIIKRKLSKTLGQIHFWVTTIGLIILIGSSQYLGFPGIPNRYYEFDAFDTQLDVGWMNEFFIFVIIIMILAQLIFFINLIYSLTKPITKE